MAISDRVNLVGGQPSRAAGDGVVERGQILGCPDVPRHGDFQVFHVAVNVAPALFGGLVGQGGGDAVVD